MISLMYNDLKMLVKCVLKFVVITVIEGKSRKTVDRNESRK